MPELVISGTEVVSILQGIIAAILVSSGAIIWHGSRIKANVDMHGNAIGELKRRMDGNDNSIKDHNGRIARIEGQTAYLFERRSAPSDEPAQ